MVQDEARRREIENFHGVLSDISYCECTPAVRDFIIDAYVRGAQKSGGTAEYCQIEGNTAVPGNRYQLGVCVVRLVYACVWCRACVHGRACDKGF